MTHEEALLKLLAIEPVRHDELARITGWPPAETMQTLQRLQLQHKVTHWNGAGTRWLLATGAATQGAR